MQRATRWKKSKCSKQKNIVSLRSEHHVPPCMRGNRQDEDQVPEGHHHQRPERKLWEDQQLDVRPGQQPGVLLFVLLLRRRRRRPLPGSGLPRRSGQHYLFQHRSPTGRQGLLRIYKETIVLPLVFYNCFFSFSVNPSCEGKRSCTLGSSADELNFGSDPCPPTYKYLEVLYACAQENPEVTFATACQRCHLWRLLLWRGVKVLGGVLHLREARPILERINEGGIKCITIFDFLCIEL